MQNDVVNADENRNKTYKLKHKITYSYLVTQYHITRIRICVIKNLRMN